MSSAKNLICILALLLSLTNASAQWSQTSGPKGIQVNVIYKTGTTLYAGTENKGIYKSTDNGTTWVFAGRGIENTRIADIVFMNGNLLAAVSSECSGKTNVFKSSDNGTTWTVTSGLANQFVNSFAIKGNDIYAGASTLDNGVYKSSDNGNTWAVVNSPIDDAGNVFVSGNAIIVSNFNFIWRSINDGRTWQLTEQFALSGINDFAKADTTLFAASSSGYYTSVNNGSKWIFHSFTGGGVFSLSADTVNKIIYLGSTGKVYKSSNEGATFTNISTNLGFGAVQSLLYSSNNLYAALPFDTAGVYISKNNGANWVASANGFVPASSVRSLVTLGNYVFAGMQYNGIYRSKDNGNKWTKVGLNNDSLSHEIVFSMCVKNGVLFAGTANGVYRSNDSGITFTKKVNGFATGGTIGIPSLTVSGNRIIAATNISFKTTSQNAIYYTNNNGDTWSRAFFPNESVFMSSVACDGSDTVFAGSYGQSFSTTGLYKSFDGGVNWVSKTFSINADIDVLAVKGKHVLAGNLFGSFFSNNGGEFWFSTSVPGGGVFAYTFFGNTVFAGNQEGVFYSKDFGATWNDFNSGLPNCPTLDVEALTAGKNVLFAGTFLNAVWKYQKQHTVPDVIIADKSSSASYLAQNFPNPFMSSTTINYTVIKTGLVSLKVYDKYGNTAAVLVNELKQPGNYNINLNASNYKLQPGVYYYELRTGDVIESKKMLVIK